MTSIQCWVSFSCVGRVAHRRAFSTASRLAFGRLLLAGGLAVACCLPRTRRTRAFAFGFVGRVHRLWAHTPIGSPTGLRAMALSTLIPRAPALWEPTDPSAPMGSASVALEP